MMPVELREALSAERAKLNGHDPAAAATSWGPVDLAPALDGRALTAPPALLERTDGVFLLYPGKVHSFFGEPEACKGWLGLGAIAECLAAGQPVVYVDFEDGPETAVERLRALHVDPGSILALFRYVRPDEKLDERGWRDLATALEIEPTLVLIDGLTEAIALQGLNLNDNGDVATWLRLLPRPLANRGAAVVLIDHVVKDKEARGRYAIGAQHKLAGVDVTYRLEVLEPFGRGREGLVKVSVGKDRPGHMRQHAEGQRIADMRLTSLPDGTVQVDLAPPHQVGDSFRPTVLMERVSRAIEETPGLTQNGIRAAVKGKHDAKLLALELLRSEGYVELVQEGQAQKHFSRRPFREDDPDTTAPEPVPNRAPAQSAPNRAPVPHPVGGPGTGRGSRTPAETDNRAPEGGTP